MTKTSTITLRNVVNTYNSDGEATATTSTIAIDCYVDFFSSSLRVGENGENIVSKGKVFVSNNLERDKITFVPNEIEIDSKIYSVIDYNSGVLHTEIIF